MEIFNVYSWMKMLLAYPFSMSGAAEKLGPWGGIILLAALGLATAIWSVFFIFQAIGLFVMAKKQGVKGKLLAFIPFLNYILMEKLIGEYYILSKRVKHIGVFVMFAQFISFVFLLLDAFAGIYLYTFNGIPQYTKVMLGFVEEWTALTGFSYKVGLMYDMLALVITVTQFVSKVAILLLVIGLYRKYQPQRAFLLVLLTHFIPFARNVIIFALRKKPAIDYAEYVRKQREEFLKRQQEWQRQYQQQYGGPFGMPQNQPPQDNPQGEQSTTQDDPFAEFNETGDKKEDASTDEKKGDDWFA